MRRITLLLAAAVAAGACSQSQPEVAPAPTPAPVDSAAIRAREDSIRNAQAEAERRAREEAERLRREAEAARAQLTADLAAMIHFDYDQSAIRAEDQAILDRKAAILAANPAVRVRISGHADERGSDEYNLALGNRRAAAAKRYLAGRGVTEARMDIVSYGEERPVAAGQNEGAWAQNRRAEFEITAGGADLRAPN
jgi:peptidoglycan-associated lipoprotein